SEGPAKQKASAAALFTDRLTPPAYRAATPFVRQTSWNSRMFATMGELITQRYHGRRPNE
ncbi:MAG: hypothetical protein M3128_11255, partial [Verrucomicrobiota bacterium]|nr:hypothetical protein [Verrucomicrobiota bacterium]